MVRLSVVGDLAVFEVEGIDRIWTLRSRLEIPLAHILGVHADSEIARNWWLGFKLAGTHIPGVIAAGTFYHEGDLVFWDVHHPENAIVVDLAHERYGHLVIEVADPAASVALLQSQLGSIPIVAPRAPKSPRDGMKALVADELARIASPGRRSALAKMLIEPEVQLRFPELGPPGARYPTWLVARAPDRAIGLAYTEFGYGPQRPWGYVSVSHLSLGMNEQWHERLEEAFVASGLWKEK